MKTLLNDGRNNTIKIDGDFWAKEMGNDKYYFTANGSIDVNNRKEYYGTYNNNMYYSCKNLHEANKFMLENFAVTIMETLQSYINKNEKYMILLKKLKKKKNYDNR